MGGPFSNYQVCYPSMRVIEDPLLTETIEDWSHVRSPARAARRLRRGFRQNIIYRQVPRSHVYMIGDDTMVMHPEMAREMERQLERRIEREMERVVFGGALNP